MDRGSRRAFTLIELILVMALLAIAATLTVPRMSSFYRGRALDMEARRMLSLTRYGQSRAVDEGVPILLWVNPKDSTYGLTVQPGYLSYDRRALTYEADSTLSFYIPASNVDASYVSEQQDERLGLPTDVAIIRFNPDGYYDEISQPQIVIRQGNEAALVLSQTANRLRYEICTYSLN